MNSMRADEVICYNDNMKLCLLIHGWLLNELDGVASQKNLLGVWMSFFCYVCCKTPNSGLQHDRFLGVGMVVIFLPSPVPVMLSSRDQPTNSTFSKWRLKQADYLPFHLLMLRLFIFSYWWWVEYLVHNCQALILRRGCECTLFREGLERAVTLYLFPLFMLLFVDSRWGG